MYFFVPEIFWLFLNFFQEKSIYLLESHKRQKTAQEKMAGRFLGEMEEKKCETG